MTCHILTGKTLFSLKIKNISLSAPKCQFSAAGKSLIQPLLEPFKHNLSQNSNIKSLFQPLFSRGPSEEVRSDKDPQ